ncbi:MAG TPA: LacI family DNA-binding transcriptional regulator, partial [Reyranella sp.]|nr:LacI family DNA-binding transcriptional regulator [Reyranella sp.]
RLRYRPDSGARGLRLSQRFSIGILIIDPSPAFIADPFTTNLVAGLSNHLNARGYGLLVQGASLETLSHSALLNNLRTDGLCLMPSGTRRQRLELYRRSAELGQPVLVFQEEAPDFLVDAASVRQDDRGGAVLLMDRLLAQGYRDFWFVTTEQHWPALEQREKGIREALRKRGGGGTRLSKITYASGAFAAIQESFGAAVAERGLPEAVLCANDQTAIAVMKWLAKAGVAVPEKVAVAGFNGFEFWQYSTPTVTTVHSPAYDLGKSGGELMLDRLQHGAFTRRDVLHGLELLAGESA